MGFFGQKMKNQGLILKQTAQQEAEIKINMAHKKEAISKCFDLNNILLEDLKKINYQIDADHILSIVYIDDETVYSISQWQLNKQHDAIILTDGIKFLTNNYFISYKENNYLEPSIFFTNDDAYVLFHLTADNILIRNNFKIFESTLNQMCNRLMKVFLDVSGQYDYPEVRLKLQSDNQN